MGPEGTLAPQSDSTSLVALAQGESQQLTATDGDGGSLGAVTWRLTEGRAGTVTSDGLVTAAQPLTPTLVVASSGARVGAAWVRTLVLPEVGDGIAAVTIGPIGLDVSSGSRSTAIQVRMRRARSGIASLSLSLKNGTAEKSCALRRVFGTARIGGWRCDITFSDPDPAGGWGATLTLVDTASGQPCACHVRPARCRRARASWTARVP